MKPVLVLLFALVFVVHSHAQPGEGKVIDEVVAVVGGNMIRFSDIENQYMQFRLQGNIEGARSMRCQILENMLFQKLLINQAVLDSVEVTDAQVESEMDRKLRYFISQIGSREKLEAYYKKSIPEIKEEFRDAIRDQLIVETMQGNITRDIKVTPSEVKRYYQTIPEDSLPLINSEVEIGQIVKKPPMSPEEKAGARSRLADFRKRILGGESFAALAALYSEDPGSTAKGGELGFVSRGELFPAFEAAAFSLKKGEVSEIVETEAGYHIIQLIERRGDMINARHILIRPKVSPDALAKAQQDLNNVVALINMDSLSFEQAALKHSDDPSKNNGGIMVNPMTGTTRFETSQLDPSLFFVLDKMQVGETSEPVLMKTEEGTQAYRILFLKSRSQPHRANLNEDYTRIQEWALQDKQATVIQEYINRKTKNTYIRINERYRDCPFNYSWGSTED